MITFYHLKTGVQCSPKVLIYMYMYKTRRTTSRMILVQRNASVILHELLDKNCQK